MAAIGGINSNQYNVLINSQKNDAQGISGAKKNDRVQGQTQHTEVRVATPNTQQNQTSDNHFAHQHHIAFNAYRNFGKEAAPATTDKEQGVVDVEGEVVDTSRDTQKPAEQEKKVSNEQKKPNGEEFTEEELKQIEDMKARDQEVRVHEQAHKSAGGQYAASPTYTYETGPDGKRYVTDGEVSIDVGEESDPQATIDKMQVVKRAAMAPAEPSSADRQVYADASRKEAAARQELAEDKKKESEERIEKAKEAIGADSKAEPKSKDNSATEDAKDKLNPENMPKPKSAEPASLEQ